jgi:hypothetical protein
MHQPTSSTDERVCHHIRAIERLLKTTVLTVVLVNKLDSLNVPVGCTEVVLTADGTLAEIDLLVPAGYRDDELRDVLDVVARSAHNASKSL